MDAKAGRETLQGDQYEIPKSVEIASVRNLIRHGLVNPNMLAAGQGKEAKTSEASFLQICDHLEIRFVSGDKYQGIRATEVTIDEDGPNDLLVPNKAGDMVTVIEVSNDATITDLIILVEKIREISKSSLKSPMDVLQMQEWVHRVGMISRNLRQTALAMERVRQLAGGVRPNETDFDLLYKDVTRKIFFMSEAINLDRHDEQPDTLVYLYRKLVDENDDDSINSQLAEGLRFSRYGSEDKTIDDDPNKAFSRMVALYQHVSGVQSAPAVGRIIDSVINNCIPHQLETTRKMVMENEENATKITGSLVEEVVLRGIEQTYQRLPIPAIVKEFVGIDLKNLDAEALKYLVESLDEHFDYHNVITAFQSVSFSKDALYLLGLLDKNDQLVSMSFSDIYARGNTHELLRAALGKWQDNLVSLGLQKEKIKTFGEWFEDPDFFDERKVEHLEEILYGPVYSWKSDTNITSINQVVNYYESMAKDETKLEEFVRFQKAMLLLVIEEMRLNYGGWVDDDVFGEIKDVSPSIIASRMKLNCVGRSNLLLAVGSKLGIRGTGAETYLHITTAFKFANGEHMVVEASGSPGAERIGITRVEDPDGLLYSGEEVWEATGPGKKRYFVSSRVNMIATSIVEHFANNSVHRTRLSESVFGLANGPTSTVNIFARELPGTHITSISEAAKLMNRPEEQVRWLLRRIHYLAPDFLEKISENGVNLIYQNNMKVLISEAIEE